MIHLVGFSLGECRPSMNKVKQHRRMCKKLEELYKKKNHDYGDSFSKSYEEYGLTMACIRLQDKVNRLKVLAKTEGKVEDETLEDTLMDLANYSILTLIELDKREEEKC